MHWSWSHAQDWELSTARLGSTENYQDIIMEFRTTASTMAQCWSCLVEGDVFLKNDTCKTKSEACTLRAQLDNKI